jgi:hypothetical protein
MSDKPSVDELRARLRELGYLDAGVDRFVLGPVRGSRSLLSGAWRSSARIGLLAATLLGPSTAASLAVRVPGLVTGPRDAIVLALYLGIFFGVAVAVGALAAALVLGAVAPRLGAQAGVAARARVLSMAAGGIVAIGGLAYLVFWWRTVSPAGAPSYRSPWTWLALVVAVGISVLLGHLVRLTTLAVTARGTAAAAGMPGRFRRSPAATLGLAALGLGAAAGLLFVAAPKESGTASRSAAPLHAVPTGVRLTVIAIDGLDADYLERLATGGSTPALARLLDGARATLPASDAEDPARTWTSLATGQPAEVHGVGGIETRRVSGLQGTVEAGGGVGAAIAAATDAIRLTRPVLTTSAQRRSKTFWEVAADAGLPTLVVNWWATWPVPQGSGVVLSDRATLRLDRGGELDAEIAPPALYAALRRDWPGWRDEARRGVAAAFPRRDDPVEQVLRRAAEQDLVASHLAARVAAVAPRLRAVYLPGLDIAQHELLASRGGLPPSAIAARVEALERYYVFLDGIVSSLAGSAANGGLVALLADPGRAAAQGRALLVLTGASARRGARTEAQPQDVMPTLLYALGVPASRELHGRPLTELFDAGFTARVPPRVVDAFGPPALAPRQPGAAPLDREMLERLKSLGYVR